MSVKEQTKRAKARIDSATKHLKVRMNRLETLWSKQQQHTSNIELPQDKDCSGVTQIPKLLRKLPEVAYDQSLQPFKQLYDLESAQEKAEREQAAFKAALLIPQCACKFAAVQKQVNWTRPTANAGRPYWTCRWRKAVLDEATQEWQTIAGCDHFEWVSESYDITQARKEHEAQLEAEQLAKVPLNRRKKQLVQRTTLLQYGFTCQPPEASNNRRLNTNKNKFTDPDANNYSGDDEYDICLLDDTSVLESDCENTSPTVIS